MIYKPELEDTDLLVVPDATASNQWSLTADTKLQKTRKILMIALGVFLSFCVGDLVLSIFGHIGTIQSGADHRYVQMSHAIVSVLFYGFGLYVAHRYSEIGLRVFAWLNIVWLVIMGILISLVIIFVSVVGTVGLINNKDGTKRDAVIFSVFIVLIIVVIIIAFVIPSIIIHLSLKLARLIRSNKRSFTQQI